MDSELDVVRQINKLAGQARPVDLMMDLITRYGHWAFLIYGMSESCGIGGGLLPGTGGFGILQGTKRMRLFRAIMP